MIRNLLLTLGFIVATGIVAYAQQGAIKGKIFDKNTKEPIPFANIVLENKGSMVGGATSDFDGNYMIKPIPPGKFDLKATFVGYKTSITQGIVIGADKIRVFDIELTATSEMLEEVEITTYVVPLIDKDKTVSGATVTAEEISKMPNRNANSVATTVGGVFSQDGERGSVRGARGDQTATYIDGVRVTGMSNIPQSAIEQVDVMLSGLPARYGDVTSGVINITTKGPARQFGAGIELESSQFLDPYGHNRVSFSLMGPLIKGKNKNNTALLGFFIAGEGTFNKDGRPSSKGYYSINDDVLSSIEQNPLRPSGSGTGTFLNAEYLRKSDLEHHKTSANTSRQTYNIIGNINIRTTETINLTIGGSYIYRNRNGYSYGASLANSNKNTVSVDEGIRGYIRFTQRFPVAEGSTSAFKNFYYAIQFDYTKNKGEFGDPNHGKNLFDYGYIGKFTSYKTPTFELGSDTVNGHPYNNVWLLNSWDFDTLTTWDPRGANPLVAEYTSDYYDIYEGEPEGHYRNYDEIILGGGLYNGSSPDGIYGLYQSPGTNQSGYGKYNNDQYNIRFDASLDIKNHALKLGLQYEQRINRAVNYGATGLWNLMRGRTNFQLQQLDLDNPQLISYDGQVDTILYPRKYDAFSHDGKLFDKELRTMLGLPVDGLDYIVIDSYDSENNTLDYYDGQGIMHSGSLGDQSFNIGMFSPDALLNNGSSYIYYSGYDYQGNVLKGQQPSFEDFWYDYDIRYGDTIYTRPVGAFRPIYMAGYIQDQFAFKDLIFNIGVRVDRYDANQKVLADPYLLYPAKTVQQVTTVDNVNPVTHPSNMGEDYVVYVDRVEDPQKIVGYRNGYTWYNADGIEINDLTTLDVGNGISPMLINPKQDRVLPNSFKDYDPQINVMPRISFSFPISDEALFFAHYDILTQRPTGNMYTTPSTWYFFNSIGGTINNPSLKPTKTIDYELGFQQKVSNTSSVTITAFYREMRDMTQQFRFTGAYPKDYTSYNNIDFGTVKGLTFGYDLRRTNNLRLRASYTLQFADATGSSNTTAAALIRSGLPNLRSTFPMPWDRRHAFNIVLDYRWAKGKDYTGPSTNRDDKGKAPIDWLSSTGFSLTIGGGSGVPYTASRNVTSPVSGGTRLLKGTYSGSRLPWQFRLDFKVDKEIYFKAKESKGNNAKRTSMNIYFQILNLLDTKNVINVYSYTGNPNDDGYLSAPEYQREINNQLDPQSFRDMYGIYVDNPSNYSAPRQIRIGLIFSF